MKHFLLVLAAMLALLAGATPLVAQPMNAADSSYFEQFRGLEFSQIVDKVWLWTCATNREYFPDSNRVLPGEVIKLPRNVLYVAKPNGGQDHMWQASLHFTNEYILPYLEGGTVKPIPGQTPSNKVPSQNIVEDKDWLWWVIGLLIFIILVLVASIFKDKAREKEVNNPPFLATPPDLHAPDAEVLPAAEASLRQSLGRGFQIVGAVERGTLNGEQTMFFSNGTHRTEHFHNEPGFRARVRFDDGTERQIVARWSCFNPVWGAKDAKFEGTFTPNDGQAQPVPVLSAEQTATIARNIQRVNTGVPVTAQPSTVPETPAPKAPETAQPKVEEPQPPASPTPDGTKRMKLAKLQFSTEKGLNLEGEIPVELEELKSIIALVQQGKAPIEGGEQKKDK